MRDRLEVKFRRAVPAALVAVSILLAGCGAGGQTPDSPAQDADAALIRELFRDFSEVWHMGTDETIAFLVEHNHPELGTTEQECRSFFADLPSGYREEIVLDAGTIERDDGWTIPAGRAEGVEPSGRTYVFGVEISYFTDAGTDSSSDELHATILDGRARIYRPCERLDTS